MIITSASWPSLYGFGDAGYDYIRLPMQPMLNYFMYMPKCGDLKSYRAEGCWRQNFAKEEEIHHHRKEVWKRLREHF